MPPLFYARFAPVYAFILSCIKRIYCGKLFVRVEKNVCLWKILHNLCVFAVSFPLFGLFCPYLKKLSTF